jgi:hypothetical protein
MSAKRENEIENLPKELCDFGAFAGGTPAVPANHLRGFGVYGSGVESR